MTVTIPTGVPLLDTSHAAGTPAQRAQYNADLLAAFQSHGFVRLRNHGISDNAVRDLFSWGEELFHLDDKQKETFENVADGKPQRGYSAVGVEKSSTLYGKMMGLSMRGHLKDAREHFDCGRPNDSYSPNRWPSEEIIPGFRTAMESYYLQMENCCLEIITSLEEALHAPQDTFGRLITRNNAASEFRINHYPPVSLSTLRGGTTTRIWPHFDLGVITLLFVSGVGGLEVEDRAASASTGNQTFIPLLPESPYELIVNISETFQRWTNDLVPAGLHRVTVPVAQRDEVEGIVPRRFSVAYFCKADRDAPAGTLPEFKGIKESEYENLTALEYHQKRLAAAY